MANINVSSIEGFDGMTAEQKVEALLKFNIPDEVDLTKFVEKSVFDKKASEAAELSKQLKAKMTEDEAHKYIGKEAMDQGVSRRKIAEAILAEG